MLPNTAVAQGPDGGWLYVGDPLVVMGRVSNDAVLAHIPALSCPVAIMGAAIETHLHRFSHFSPGVT
jgi:hypothetical protein